jgi:hypothetical protein
MESSVLLFCCLIILGRILDVSLGTLGTAFVVQGRRGLAEGFRVTAFPAEGRDGPLEMLFIEIPRKQARDIVLSAEEIDPHCFCIVEDIRQAIPAAAMLHQPTGWRDVTKKK